MTPAATESSPLPKYLDVVQQVEAQIDSGELKPGDRLPSFVRMQEHYGATTATIERVVRTLETKGLVRREPSRGIFVTARATNRSKGVIGVLTQTVYRQHPYYATILNGVQEEARDIGVEILLLLENSIVSRDKVDGLLAVGAQHNPVKQIPFEMPAVSVMGTHAGMSGVLVDDRQGTALIMEHLLGLGHRRIGFLTMGHRSNSDAASRGRFETYREVLLANGIEPDPRWVKGLREEGETYRGFAITGREKMERWLAEDWAELGCTALLTQNDEVAIQASLAFQEHGYKVPEQVSVVGFDDSPVCLWTKPFLTTVHVGLETVGAHALRLLLEKIAEPASGGDGRETSIVRLPTKLVVRESTGPAPS